MSNNWIESIKQNPNAALKNVYSDQKEFCLAWMQKNTNLSANDQLEVFQNAVIILYDNIMSGKLTEATAKLSSYLISICKNKSKEVYRRHAKQAGEDSIPILIDHIKEEQEDIKEVRIKKVASTLIKMGSPCKDIIELYYYQKMSMADIGSLMSYKNVETVKNQKYKCMKRLRKLSLII